MELKREDVRYIVIHCSATKEGQDIGRKEIDHWHRNKGWSGIGYHYVIKLDGTLELGRPYDQVGAHVYGHNRESIGIVYVGGLDSEGEPKDTRTDEQKETMKSLVRFLKNIYEWAEVKGHRDFSPDIDGDGIIEPFEFMKACPCFNVSDEQWT